MLRSLLGVSLPDHICNDTVWKQMGTAPISKKMQKKCLQWYGHILRAAFIAHIALHFNIDGKCPHRRPKQRWQDTINVEMKNAQLDTHAAFDRARQCLLTQKTGPAPAGESSRMIMVISSTGQPFV